MDDRLRPLALSVPQYACLTALQDTPGIVHSLVQERLRLLDQHPQRLRAPVQCIHVNSLTHTPRSPESLGVLIKETQSLLNQRMDDRLRPLALSVPQMHPCQ
jgi:hypothetical protein